MTMRAFRKMHGLGNDFVVVDARKEPFRPSAEQARLIGNRRWGVGFDQLIVLEPAPMDSGAALFMRVLNADGSESGACGNATRCVAALIFQETGNSKTAIATLSGLLPCRDAGDGLITVDMGPARLGWRDIPLAVEMDTAALDFELGPLKTPVAVNVGNPHVVFHVEDVSNIALDLLGPKIEHHSLFPERTNVQIIQPLSRTHIKHRIWERGAGITEASGSGGCAAMIGAVRMGLAERQARIDQPGGTLHMEWREDDGHILMTGPWAEVFTGELNL